MTPEARKTLGACAKVMGLTLNSDSYGDWVLRGMHKFHWNPFTSVADAAELAIKLKIDVWWNEGATMLYAQDCRGMLPAIPTLILDHPSEQAAYCYAICKVAEQLSERKL